MTPTKNIIVPIDGSECALRALEVAIGRSRECGAPLTLLNAQMPIISGNVRHFVSREAIHQYHEEEADAALAPAVRIVQASGRPYATVKRVGHPYEVIIEQANAATHDEIVMGTRGMSSLANLVLGSVATKVIHAVRVPVTLVK